MKKHLTTILLILLGCSYALLAQTGPAISGENETRLLSLPNLEQWQPPVEKEKVWSSKQILSQQIRFQQGRHVCLEKCATELVDAKVPATTPTTDQSTGDVVPAGDSGYLAPFMVGVSASVYKEGDKVFTRLQVMCGQTVCEAWSNIDFNHFRGATYYIANGREYYQVGGYGEGEFITASEAGCPVNAPEFKGDQHGFVVTSPGGINETNMAYIALFDMHSLYEVEKETLAEAHEVMLANQELSRKWHEANPKQPKDITIRFWKKEPKTR